MILFSTECKEIFKAFHNAQREFPTIPKSGYNPHFKSSFSTLEDYEQHCGPILHEHGIAWSQPQTIHEGQFVIVTLLLHVSGQWMKSIIPIQPEKMGPQPVGSYITYMRRYALSSILGVSGSEDDDGNSNTVEDKISKEQFTELASGIKSLPNAVKVHKDILNFNKIERLEDLPTSLFRNVKSYLEKIKS